MSEAATLGLSGLVCLAAAFIQGVTGFGHALVAIGFLSFLLGPKEAVLVLSLVAPVIAIAVWLKVRHDVDWREVTLLSLPLCLVGLPLGILLFTAIDATLLTRVVGVILVASAGYFLTPWAPSPERVHPAFGVAAGTAAGFLGGLASTGGPPLVLYLYARRMDKARRMAVLQAVFVISSLAKVLQLLPTGMLTARTWGRAGALAVPIVVGVLLGHMVFRRIPAEPLRRGALALLLVVGAVMIVKG